jgi:hypothetical protein
MLFVDYKKAFDREFCKAKSGILQEMKELSIMKLNWNNLFTEDVGNRKIAFLWTVGGNTALTSWRVAMNPTSVHQS